MRGRLLPLLLVSVLALPVACSTDAGSGSGGSERPSAGSTTGSTTGPTTGPPTGPTTAGAPTDPAASEGTKAALDKLDGVTVTNRAALAPKVAIDDPYTVDETTVQVLAAGDGPAVADGDQVTVHLVLANGASGRVLDSSYKRGQPFEFQMQSRPGGLLPGLYAGLLGQPAGSRIAVAVPPESGYGQQGNPQFGVQPTDTLVFVLDIEKVADVPTIAEGRVMAAPDDLPTLALDGSGVPQRFVAQGDERAGLPELVVAPVIVGEGLKVQAGQTLTVHFLGQIYPHGEIFDQSWTGEQPFGFQVGTGAVMPGWDRGLVGQRVGSRVILAVPSDLAYGEAGQGDSIPPNSDLMFVIDILAAG